MKYARKMRRRSLIIKDTATYKFLFAHSARMRNAHAAKMDLNPFEYGDLLCGRIPADSMFEATVLRIWKSIGQTVKLHS